MGTKINTISEPIGFTVEIPRDKVNLDNLNALLAAKSTLIKHALGVDELPIEVRDDKVCFPWFSELPDAGLIKACTRFIAALCEMSIRQKRVTATEREVDNERYAFRCFLLRLNFIGNEYKADRRILLRNLSGNGSFKSGDRRQLLPPEELPPQPISELIDIEDITLAEQIARNGGRLPWHATNSEQSPRQTMPYITHMEVDEELEFI
ncbi:MAG: hypothetical protein NC246_07805 [Muribaculaceae bacterium]|nr:hypothetical protein [Muribaculaceae bacterium]